MAFLLAAPLVSGALSSAGVATLISSAGTAVGALSSFGLMSSATAAPAVLLTVSTAGATAAVTAVGAAAAATTTAATTGAVGSLLASLGLMSSAAAAPTVFFAVSTASATATAVTAAGAATAVAVAAAGAGFAFKGGDSADKRSNFVPTPSASATRSKDSAAPSTPSATAHTKPNSWNSTESAGSETPRSSTSTGQGDPPRVPENGGTKFSRTVKVVAAAGCAVAAGAVVYTMIPVAAPAAGLAYYTPAWAQPVVVAIGDLGASAYGMVGGVAGGASLGLLTGLVKAIGFGEVGIAAESIAAKMMSSWAVANGGGVASGSLVSVLQSIGAAGFGLGTLGCFIGVGIIGGVAYYYFCGTAVASVSAVSNTWMALLKSYAPWLGLTCVVIIVGGYAYKYHFRDGKLVPSDDSVWLSHA